MPAAQGNRRAGVAPPIAESAESLAWLGWFRFVAITGVVLIHVNGLTAVDRYGDGS